MARNRAPSFDQLKGGQLNDKYPIYEQELQVNIVKN